jgi:hypothetical protein
MIPRDPARPDERSSQPPPSLRTASVPALRPLASVDIPLLREQRSALRNKRFLQVGAVVGVLLALGGGVYTLVRDREPALPLEETGTAVHDTRAPEPPPEPEPAAVVVAPAAPAPAAVDQPAPRLPGRYERTFGKSLSFGDALLKAGLDNGETNAVINALTGSFDFRKAQPDDELIIERGAQGRLDRFEYRATPTVRYEAVRTEAGFDGHPIQLQIESKHIARGGYVEGQLGDAMAGMKLGRALTGVFADVLGRKVHFSTETRPGDSFRVIAEEEWVDGELLRYGTVHALEYKSQRTTARAFYYESKGAEGDFYDEKGRALHGGWLRTPLRYDHISSGYGVRFHPILKRKVKHDGIDYAAPSGTQVRAAAAGVVRTVGPRGINGNLVSIVHPHGFETFYCHLSRFAPGLKPGSKVKQRQLIAYVGSTGRSTGPHLHFALKRNGALIDPNSQLNGPGLPLASREMADFNARVKALGEELAAIELERPTPIAPPPSAEADLDEDEL